MVVAAWAGIALIAGYGTSLLCATTGANPLFAAAGVAVVAGAFGWTRRDRGVLDVALPSIVVTYAAFIGIAIERVPHTVLKVKESAFTTHGLLVPIGPLANEWPVVLVGGIACALILTVAVAVPVSMIPVRRKADPQAHDRFWAVVAERNAHADDVRQAPPIDRGNPGP